MLHVAQLSTNQDHNQLGSLRLLEYWHSFLVFGIEDLTYEERYESEQDTSIKESSAALDIS